MSTPAYKIGFVSTRISGTDGVSLEIGKWSEILRRMGHECFFIAGTSDRDPELSHVIEEADFRHPTIDEINSLCFGHESRSREMSSLIHSTAQSIKNQLCSAVEAFKLDVIIAQNALTLPINIPLGIALDELLVETQIPCIAHHHDFVWERERYLINAVDDFVTAHFPPRRHEIEHVVINSLAGMEFSRRTGLPYRVIPNVMNLDEPPQPPDDYTCDFREVLGLKPDDIVILQPTRVVQRKGIEHGIELVRRLDDPRCRLVISHDEGDEGPEYPKRVRQYAEMLGVEIVFANDCIAHCRCQPDGRKCFSIWDAYQCADLIAYPSTYEGFGNAFLEAVYFRKPVFCNRYTIFRSDIEPCGFRPITMDGFVTDAVVDDVRRVLRDVEYRQQMVDHNYEVATRFFSFRRVADELAAILANLGRPLCREHSRGLP